MRYVFGSLCLLIALAAPGQQQKKVRVASLKSEAKPMLWQDRGPITAAEMDYGSGSEAGAPKPFPNGTFHFVKEEIKSTFPKIEVKDANGHKFKVKFPMGADSKSHTEVVNNRLLWAMGFRSREIYYVPSGKLDGFKPGDPKHPERRTKMNGKLVKNADGTYQFADVTFTAKDDDEAEDSWGYEDTNLPAAIGNSPQFTWLKIFDVLIGNWDTGTKNHAIYYEEAANGARQAWYQDKDVGTGYGSDHPARGLLRVKPTRWNLKDYQKSRFVIWDEGRPNEEVKGDSIHLDYSVVATTPHCQQIDEACSKVSKADAKAFVEQVLNRIPPDAIREAFKASGASPAEVEGFSTALLDRIQQLRAASGAGNAIARG